MTQQVSKLPLFPLTAGIDGHDHLEIGGCDTVRLAAEYGTPLYVYDEATLRGNCEEFKTEFGTRYNGVSVNYSCKAFINKAVLKLFADEGLGLDVVSGGEIGYAQVSGFPMDRVGFPGNNKSAEELALALEAGVGHIIVDNLYELGMLRKIARQLDRTPNVLLRLTPGVDPHTHKLITTGNTDSKFGIPIARGEEAVTAAMTAPEINLTGLHFHIGSQITETEPYIQAISIITEFAGEMGKKHGFELKELSVGGGYAFRYTLDSPVPDISQYAETITLAVIAKCQEHGIKHPHLIIEPGRLMVAGAGVALYTAGAIKDIPGIRRYVSVDGGMADNIRPALYQAQLEAVVSNKMSAEEAETVSICGKYCEASDILIKDISLPAVTPGDIIAVPGCGAYNLTESTNYNASFRPAIVMVSGGSARLIRRRETLEDLTRQDQA